MQLLRNPIALIATGLSVIALVVAGLLLPPIALGQRLLDGAGFVELTGDQPSLSLDQGLTVGLDPATLPPGFTVKLEAIPNGKFLKRQTDTKWQAAAGNLPSFLMPTGPVFGVETRARGEAPRALNLTLKIPSNSQPYETLDLYAWDGTRWMFVPSQIQGDSIVAQISPGRLQPGGAPAAIAVMQTKPAIPLTATLLEPGHVFSSEAAAALNSVAPSALTPTADGALAGALAGGYERHQGYAVTPVVRNHAGADGTADTATLTSILTDPKLQNTHIQALVNFAIGDDYDGLILDYRGVDPVQRMAFSTFVNALAAGLHAQKKTLAVLVPAPGFDGTSYETGGYDWAEIGFAADAVLVPISADPAAAGNGDNDRLFAWAVRSLNRYKMQLVTSSLGADSVAGLFTLLDYPTALNKFGTASLVPDLGDMLPGKTVSVTLSGSVQTLDYDSAAAAPRFTYLDEAGTPHTAWFGTTDALLFRLVPIQKYHLGGVVVRDLLGSSNAPGILSAVARYRANQAAAGATPLTLVWTVNASGAPIAQATGAPDAPFLWPAGQPGPYEIAAFLQGGRPGEAPLGAVALTVPAASPSAIPPTATVPGPTASPRLAGPTATPCGDCPTAAPPPPTAPPAPIVINPGASGAFELGGQALHGGITYSADMKRAGMNWVKIQGYYGDDLGPAIANAHALGFRILLSVTDLTHAAAPVTSASYQQAFGQYLATLAAQGADAIEVWNEPNIDREWPTGQVSGANYTQLLKTVYPMIKVANGNTMVVSAAPAPTGYFGGGCAPQGCNDDVFLQAVTAAGGANYLDCVGIHFNSGTTSPSATSGSALSGYHYSYYYWPMVNTYRAAFNNSRQLCFTELGILTGEGYSPDLASVAPSFSWAAGNTVAQQAAWLAEAATLSRDSGVVRMMIVFNVDFPGWGADPQAGYAIERPGNICPACDALDAVIP